MAWVPGAGGPGRLGAFATPGVPASAGVIILQVFLQIDQHFSYFHTGCNKPEIKHHIYKVHSSTIRQFRHHQQTLGDSGGPS
jgi:hypothetical protein